MSESDNEYPREHHFYVAVAKHVFAHKKHGIVFVRDPLSLKDADQYGLKPLILYGVTVPGTQILWLTFTPIDQPRTFTSVLEEAWRDGNGLRGKPDILKVSRHITFACPDLATCLAKLGIALLTADGKDKRFSSSLRSAHLKSTELDHYFGERGSQSVINMNDLLFSAKRQHVFDSNFVLSRLVGEERAKVDRWLNIPFNAVTASIPDVNWTPGPWLSAWEANLPPSSPRFFTSDTPKWLILGRDEDTDDSFDDDRFEAGFASPFDLIKLMIKSFPNTVNEVAQEIGVKHRELLWFLSGRVDLPNPALDRLLCLLQICIRWEGYYEATGPCVLVARTLRSIARAYDELSHGGDLAFSFEALPDKGMPEPSWRYLVFQSCSGKSNIIMIPRGSHVSEQLNSEIFINFEGERQVPALIYREIVRTCAIACVAPANNSREIERFVMRHAEYRCGLERWGCF